jgi:hypothetical protein
MHLANNLTLITLLGFTAVASSHKLSFAEGGSKLLPCAYGKAGYGKPACQSSPSAGVGSGPSLAQSGTAAEIRGGFLKGTELIVAFGGIFENAQATLQGSIWGINTTTGARRVISGFTNDAATGPKRTGKGPDFGDAFDVKPGKEGELYVLSKGTNGENRQSRQGRAAAHEAQHG